MKLTDTELAVLRKMATGLHLRHTSLSMQDVDMWRLDGKPVHPRIAEFLRKHGLIVECGREHWNTDYELTQRGLEAAQAKPKDEAARLAAWQAWAKGEQPH